MKTKNLLKHIVKVCVATGVIVSLSACSHPKPKKTIEFVVPNKAKSEAAYVRSATKQLRANGVKVHVVGESVSIVSPNSKLFKAKSYLMRKDSKPILRALRKYIDHSEVINAQVATYAGKYPVSKSQAKIATKRSQVLVQHLVDMNTDVRLIAAVGDLRTTDRKSKLTFSPKSYDNLTIVSFTIKPNNWLN